MPLFNPSEEPPLLPFTAGVLNAEAVQAVAESLLTLAKESGRDALHLDLAGVNFVTASGLSGLLTLRNQLLCEGVTLTLRNVKSRVYWVIKMTGLAKLLNARPMRVALPV